MDNDIITRLEDGILTIAFNRPERKNAITGPMYGALSKALAGADSDPQVRVALIEGHPNVFTAGNDLGEFASGAAGAADDPPAFGFLRELAAFRKPLVAAVCGPAVGIGTTLLLHCDLVYAGDNASFSMPFVNLGLCTEAAASLLAPRLFGYHRAAEALLLGEAFGAARALELGLVNALVPAAQASTVARAQAAKLASKPLGSLLEIKRLMKLGQQGAVAQRMAEEATSFRRMLAEPAAREAFAAFAAKRRPDFSRC